MASNIISNRDQIMGIIRLSSESELLEYEADVPIVCFAGGY